MNLFLFGTGMFFIALMLWFGALRPDLKVRRELHKMEELRMSAFIEFTMAEQWLDEWKRSRPFLRVSQSEYAQTLVETMICAYTIMLAHDKERELDAGVLDELKALLDEQPPLHTPPATRIVAGGSLFIDSTNYFRHSGAMDEEKDDVTIEPEVDEDIGEGKPEEKIAKIREELKACRQEKQEYMDGWQRSKADYVNLLKRFETETRATKLKGKVEAVETLLPVFDALERAKEHGDLPEGFVAITKQLETAFATLGLEETGKVGEKFNPTYHEALGQDVVESKEEDDIITTILEKGWRVGESVIRPAKVRVGHFT